MVLTPVLTTVLNLDEFWTRSPHKINKSHYLSTYFSWSDCGLGKRMDGVTIYYEKKSIRHVNKGLKG
jgi:hypothetical protein